MVGTIDGFVAMVWICDDLGKHPPENWRLFSLCRGVSMRYKLILKKLILPSVKSGVLAQREILSDI